MPRQNSLMLLDIAKLGPNSCFACIDCRVEWSLVWNCSRDGWC